MPGIAFDFEVETEGEGDFGKILNLMERCHPDGVRDVTTELSHKLAAHIYTFLREYNIDLSNSIGDALVMRLSIIEGEDDGGAK